MTVMLSEAGADLAEPAEALTEPLPQSEFANRPDLLADEAEQDGDAAEEEGEEELDEIPQQEPDTMILLRLSPDQIALGPNVRKFNPDDDPDGKFAELTASVQDHGVVQPIVTTWDPESPTLLFGQRRLAAAKAAKRGMIRCILVPHALAADERILQQLDENDQRQDISATDRAQSLFDLQQLGYSVTEIARRTRMKRDAVESGLSAARVSQETKSLAGVGEDWTIVEIADLGEFEDDPAALAQLQEAKGRGQFNQRVRYLRDAKEKEAKAAQHVARLTSEGVKVLTGRPEEGKARPLYQLYTQLGKSISKDEHGSCPGHAVRVGTDWQGKVFEEGWCTSWKDAGHRVSVGAAPKPKPDKAVRRLIIENNKMWRVDRERRHEWLRELFTRKTPPKGTAQFIGNYFARCPYSYSKWIGRVGTPLAPEFIGMPTAHNNADRDAFTEKLQKMIASATEKRVILLQLVTVAAALEMDMVDPHTWRTPASQDEAREWLRFIADAGYPLSDFEQAFVDGTSGDGLKKAEASTATQPTGTDSDSDPDDGDEDEDDEFDDGEYEDSDEDEDDPDDDSDEDEDDPDDSDEDEDDPDDSDEDDEEPESE